jgi:hypothetical protein
LPSLNVSFPTVPADVGGAAVDGTSPANQVSLSLANQVITNWPPGAALWLIWDMTDPTGKAQGLAIDNLSFSAEPPFPILESAISLDGPFTQELDAVVNPAQKTITTSIKSSTRFYRLSSQVATTILTIQVQANQVTMTYE